MSGGLSLKRPINWRKRSDVAFVWRFSLNKFAENISYPGTDSFLSEPSWHSFAVRSVIFSKDFPQHFLFAADDKPVEHRFEPPDKGEGGWVCQSGAPAGHHHEGHDVHGVPTLSIGSPDDKMRGALKGVDGGVCCMEPVHGVPEDPECRCPEGRAGKVKRSPCYSKTGEHAVGEKGQDGHECEPGRWPYI